MIQLLDIWDILDHKSQHFFNEFRGGGTRKKHFYFLKCKIKMKVKIKVFR